MIKRWVLLMDMDPANSVPPINSLAFAVFRMRDSLEGHGWFRGF